MGFIIVINDFTTPTKNKTYVKLDLVFAKIYKYKLNEFAS